MRFAEECPSKRKEAKLCDDIAHHVTRTAVGVSDGDLTPSGIWRRLLLFVFVVLHPVVGHALRSVPRHTSTDPEVTPQSEDAEIKCSNGPDDIHDPQFSNEN